MCPYPTPLQEPLRACTWLPRKAAVASAFGATFDELWEQLPGDDKFREKLREWGIYYPGLSVLKLR